MSFSINAQRKEIFSSGMVTDPEVHRYMTQMDAVISRAIDAMWPVSDWPVLHLSDIFNTVAFVNYRNRRILSTNVPRSSRVLTADPMSLYTEDEMAFMCTTHEAICYSMDRSLPAPTVESLRMFRRTRIGMVSKFVDLTSAYVVSMEELAVNLDKYTTTAPITTMFRAFHSAGFVCPQGPAYTASLILRSNFAEFCQVRQALCRPFLRKVWSIVCKYVRQSDTRFLELFSWGVIGLMSAADCFEIDRKTSFGSFGEQWVVQKLHEQIKASMNPITQAPAEIQVRTKIRNVVRDNGLMDLPVAEQVTAIETALKLRRSVIAHHLQVNQALSHIININATFGDDDSRMSMGDVIPDQSGRVDDQYEHDDVFRLIQLAEAEVGYKDLLAFLIVSGQEHLLARRHPPLLANQVSLTLAFLAQPPAQSPA